MSALKPSESTPAKALENAPGNAPGNVPGNANLLIGSSVAPDISVQSAKRANQEIGVPRDGQHCTSTAKRANQEIGVPGSDISISATSPTHNDLLNEPRWNSRGYLPHFDHLEVIQHVTFHLADSLPAEALERIEAELLNFPPQKRDIERRKKMEDWIDAGHGSCELRDPVIAAMVRDSLLFFDGQRYRMLAWVIMPNHVHVLFQPISGCTMAQIVASWKKFTARKICDHRKNTAPGNANLLIGSSAACNDPADRTKYANQEIGVPRGAKEPVWHREYWDRYMRDEKHFNQAVTYIHQNPVKAGLVSRAEDWPWSSIRFRNST